jgi:molybdopterin synthase catalytic subunit/molybdopterin converting factor small subunit
MVIMWRDNQPMKIDVYLFATLRDIAGQSRLDVFLDSPAPTVDDVRGAVIALFPAIEPNLRAAIAAVNREFAFAGDSVKEGDEVAFFPPVSGGSEDFPEIIRLADSPINHDEIVQAVTVEATGAVCLFSGMVRGQTQKDGHIPQTVALEYEAYEAMALAKMRQVASEMRERWPLVQGIAIIQRVGKLTVGQNTILIACSSGHRDQGCFEAARYGIDRLKEIVPVWKKEIGPDGQVWIEGEYMPTSDDRSDS